MDTNRSYTRFDGTQITLVRIELQDEAYMDDPNSSFIYAAKECINSIKSNTFDYNRTFDIQQGSVTCFGLLVTHLGEHPSPFWFENYKSMSITSFRIKEGQERRPQEPGRTDKFVSREFPEDRCLVNEDADPFVLHLNFIGIEVDNSAVGTVLDLEVHAAPKDFREDCALDQSSASVPFVLACHLVVSQTLKLDAFVKNGMLLLEMMNTDCTFCSPERSVKMGLDVEEFEIRETRLVKKEVELPLRIGPGSQYNIAIPLPEGRDTYLQHADLLEKIDADREGFFKLAIKWSLNQNLRTKYPSISSLRVKAEQSPNRSRDIAVTCSVSGAEDSKLALDLSIRVKRRMDVCIRVLKDAEWTRFSRLIPLSDVAEVGVVEEGEDRRYSLYFYRLAGGLNVTPRMELVDRISGDVYRIGEKLFGVEVGGP